MVCIINTTLILFTSCCFVSANFLIGQSYLAEKFRRAAKFLDSSAVETQWIKQPVDHFNESDTREWNMKYFQYLVNWKSGGPIYIFIQGEAPASPSFLLSGLTYDLAVETNGGLWSTEHRYYGDSQPFPNFSVENLQYLSSRQALADVATLIRQIKLSPDYASSKVVVTGGSYAGNLAAWMRLLYPDLVDAAISSSAPVLAKVSFFEYLETVADDFKKYCAQESYNRLSAKFERVKTLLKTDNGIEQLKEEFNVCEETDLSKSENKAIFFDSLVSNLEAAAQYHNPGYISSVCDESVSVSNVIGNGTISNKSDNCLDCEFNDYYGLDHRASLGNWYYWNYQTCTEFGFFMVSPKSQLFMDMVDTNFYYKICKANYGSEFDELRVQNGVKKTNEVYGGLNPNVTNVVFVNGEIDPWHRLGIVKDLSDNAPAIVIPGASHCSDIVYSPDDTDDLKKAREEEKRLIKKWINFGINNN